MSSLKQFIRNVRSAKTIADERAVIQKESAAIRASFREESHDSGVRRNNVAKLLYLFTLGERTHFGQIECLKLLASHRFADKRLGYLGTMLLLDENQEVLTLVTNSLKNISSASPFAHSATSPPSKCLVTYSPEVENLMSTANPYIRRKAAICAMRICRKVPDLYEHFLEKAKQLLSDRNHGVLICGLTFATDLCEAEEEEEGPEGVIETFRPLAGGLVRVLKGLTTSGYAPEHDVSGITDPFLQTKILRFLRVLGRGDVQTSELINDILAQVASNTDASKNVGNSILYEAVLTILDIEADSGLRVLGVNILGKFLSNKDNNIRYVALNTLNKVVAIEPNAVQRHRNTILECLRDPDISIRRRALDLSFMLINADNVRVLVRELLAFLEVADNEFKPVMTTQIVLKLAGNYVKEQILSSFVRLIATTPELQTYAVQKLYASLKDDISQEGLTLAATWSIGEYADSLLQGGQYEEEELVKEVRDSDLVDLFTNILNSTYATQVVIEYITNASMKLTVRMSDPAQIERLRRFFSGRTADLSVEIQQRAVEYTNLFGYDQIRRGVLERMPAPEIREEQRVLGAPTKKRQSKILKSKPTKASKPAEHDLLLDLVGGSDAPVTSPTSNGSNTADLLADILGGDSGLSSPSPAPAAPNSNSAILDLFGSNGASQSPQQIPPASASMDLLGGGAPSQSASPAPVSASTPAHTAFSKDGLTLALQVQRSGNNAQIVARFRNETNFESFSNVGLQAAVPKSQRLQLSAISKSDIEAGEEGTQTLRVTAVSGALPPKLRLRLRVTSSRDGSAPVTDQVDWTEP
ncbi:Armadillo-like helical [Penicillium chermesinum]|nr:Armadillo-like helical [Penicillium chermesinum]